MDKGTWIAIVVLIIAAAGFFLLQILPPTPPSDSPAPAAQTQATSQTENTQPQASAQTPTDQTNCQSFAQAEAQQNNASLGQANFTSGACYYELDTFSSNGNVTSINEAPNNSAIASCTTNSSGSLSCQQQGASITEPQFKAFLTTYLEN